MINVKKVVVYSIAAVAIAIVAEKVIDEVGSKIIEASAIRSFNK